MTHQLPLRNPACISKEEEAGPVWEQGEKPQTVISGGLTNRPPAVGSASTPARQPTQPCPSLELALREISAVLITRHSTDIP